MKIDIPIKNLPRWCFVAFVIDMALFFSMHLLGQTICKDTIACYRTDSTTDRFANYLALVVAIMAILIPLAIELWKNQFVARNLTPKSPMDEAWSQEDRKRYLYEPVGSMAIFVGLALIFPLFIKNSALFYAALFYGIYLLVYIFWVSFFQEPFDVYELDVINPIGQELPSREVMSEFSTKTLERSLSQKTNNNLATTPIWAAQLSENKTFARILAWVQKSLKRHLKGDFNKTFLWTVFTNFISKCEIDTLWLPLYEEDGQLRTLFRDKHFYWYGNLVHAAQILKVITDRLLGEDGYYEGIGRLLTTIPTKDIPDEDLPRLLSPALQLVFLKAGDEDLILKDSLPEDWLATEKNLKTHPKLPRTTSLMYLQWTISLQTGPDEINERAVETTTEILFPEVEPMLFAKFVLLKVNLPILQLVNNPDAALAFGNAIQKWRLFGHISRTAAEWAPVSTTERLEDKFREDFSKSTAATLRLVRTLGWFRWDKSSIYAIAQILRSTIGANTWPDPLRESWREFADVLEGLFKEEGTEAK